MMQEIMDAAVKMLADPQFWTGYHLMDVLEVVVLFWTILLIRKTFKEIVKDNHQDRQDFIENLKNVRYDAVDHLYFEINKERIAHPEFSRPDLIDRKTDQWRAYSAYAFIIWNFIETICDKIPDDIKLRETWAPIILTESAIHGQWLVEQDSSGSYVNRQSFKDCFFDFGRELIDLKKRTGKVTQRDLNLLIDKFITCNK